MGTHKNYRSPVSERFCPHKTIPQHFNKRSCSDQGSRLLNMAELGSILLTNTRVTPIYQSPLSMCIISISDWLILCQLSSKILLSVSVGTAYHSNHLFCKLLCAFWTLDTHIVRLFRWKQKKAFTKALKW